ncbi:hypothetical protein GCM10007977_036370 [Dactylosporangium sucinum]|uniref:Uncharacterized protein n=1 Tax=Dactylosporangium sucinum TaxID=1424081 RepID=A0A917TQN3_9ACTN|nr:hypothetical protein GCM10007977_036370 [Dactylosporangium sucinum]
MLWAAGKPATVYVGELPPPGGCVVELGCAVGLELAGVGDLEPEGEAEAEATGVTEAEGPLGPADADGPVPVLAEAPGHAPVPGKPSLHAVSPPVASSAIAIMPTPARRRIELGRAAVWSGDPAAGSWGSPSAGVGEVWCGFILWESSRSVDIRQSTAIGLSELFGVKGGWGSIPNCDFPLSAATRLSIPDNPKQAASWASSFWRRPRPCRNHSVESMPRRNGGMES